MNRKLLIAPAAIAGLLLAYLPAWYTHREARRGVYWSNVRIGVTEVDADRFRELSAVPDDHGGSMTRVAAAGLSLELPLDGCDSLERSSYDGTRSVLLRGGSCSVTVTTLDQVALSAAALRPDLASLKEIASSPPPSFFWPLLPSSVAQSYLRYGLKVTFLGHDRRMFDNGAVRGVLGRAGPHIVTLLGDFALLQVLVRDEEQAMAIAHRARPGGAPRPPSDGAPRLVGCIECALDARSDCESACTGLE